MTPLTCKYTRQASWVTKPWKDKEPLTYSGTVILVWGDAFVRRIRICDHNHKNRYTATDCGGKMITSLNKREKE